MPNEIGLIPSPSVTSSLCNVEPLRVTSHWKSRLSTTRALSTPSKPRLSTEPKFSNRLAAVPSEGASTREISAPLDFLWK